MSMSGLRGMTESKKARIALSSGWTNGEIKAESQRAILIDFYGIEKWLPKSQVEITELPDGEVEVEPEDWLVREIEQELGEI